MQPDAVLCSFAMGSAGKQLDVTCQHNVASSRDYTECSQLGLLVDLQCTIIYFRFITRPKKEKSADKPF